jgi:Hint module
MRLRMDELRLGDRVSVAKDAFSDVFLFTHKIQRATAAFVFIRTTSDHSISMTPGHYIYANGTSLVPAASVQVGDKLTLASGAFSEVVSISAAVHAGVYNPQTLHGDIIVDGIVASTYTTAVSPVLGHASLSPLRALYSTLGMTTGLLNDGADHAVQLLPSGVHSY